MDYDGLESNAVVLGSNTKVVILIQWNYMCDFYVKLSPNLDHKEKNWFYLKALVLVLKISTQSGLIFGPRFKHQD